MIGKPTAGKGERRIQCSFHRECLDLAAAENWRFFHCEGCGLFTGTRVQGDGEDDALIPGLTVKGRPGAEVGLSAEASAKAEGEKVEEKKICKRCRENPAMLRADGQVINGMCGKCTAIVRKENAGKKKVTLPTGPGKKKDPPSRKATAGRPDLMECELLLDFTGREHVLEDLRVQAADEVRTLEDQAIWLIMANVKVAG